MRYAYAKMTFHLMLVSFLALILIGCGESGSPGGSSGPGVTASIALSAGAASLPADGKSSTPITAVLTDSVGASVYQQTSVVFTTNLGTFRNGAKEYRTTTADDTGRIVVQLIADNAPGIAKVTVTCNNISQSINVAMAMPVVGSINLVSEQSSIFANGLSSTKITATIYDTTGLAITEGTSVELVTTHGTFSNGLTTIALPTSVGGIVQTSLIAAKIGGTAEITATVGGISQLLKVLIIGPGNFAVTASPSTLAADGKSQSSITARILTSASTPIKDGTRVNFKIISGNGGFYYSFTEKEDYSYTSGGSATVRYYAPEAKPGDAFPQTVKIEASIPGEDYDAVSAELTLVKQVGNIALTASPLTLPADGSSQSTITAVVTDDNGNPVPDDTRINFSIQSGAGGLPYSMSNWGYVAGGVVSIAFGASETVGPVVIRVSSPDNVTSSTIVIDVVDRVGDIGLTANPGEIFATGEEASVITASITDPFGKPVPDYTSIYFNIKSGSGYLNYSNNTSETEYTAGGIATVNFYSKTPGKAVIEVTDEYGTIKETIEITVKPVQVGSITLSANPARLPADGTSSAQITATIEDTAGNPVPKGTSVAFSTTLGSFQNGGRSITFQTADASGVIIFSLKASAVDGIAKVTADCEGVTQSINITIGEEDQPGVAGSITLTSGTGSLPADGISSTPVTAIAYDTTGAPMPQGTAITFTTEGGKFPNGTDPDGIGKITSRVTLVTADESGKIVTSLIAGENGDIAKVQADCGGVTQVIYIVMVDPNDSVASIQLTAADTEIPADGASSTVITAIVTDNFGKPVSSGTEVLLKTNLGTFAGGGTSIVLMTSGTTGTVLTSLISGTDVGTATVTATSGSITQTVQVAFTKETVAEAEYLTLSASKTSIKTNNLDSTTITALVLDVNHAPIKGAVVNFATTGGQISAGSVVTNDNGEAVITVKSGPNKANGTIVITATVGDTLTATIPITLYGTEITLTPATAQLTIGLTPAATQQIIVKAKDADGNPIYNAAIAIGILRDPLTCDATLTPVGSQTTNVAGEIVLVLKAGTIAGKVTVTAEGLETSAEGIYTLGAAADIYEITDPATSPFSAPADGTNIPVTVHAGGLAAGDHVIFVTSFGTWDPADPPSPPRVSDNPLTVAIDAGLNATCYLSSLAAGVATIQVYAADTVSHPTLMDTVQISFFNPATRACDIIINASQTNILPSTATSQYSLTIEANVVDINGAPVGGALVNFSLSNTTGGGEYLSPVTALSDTSGIARTTFTSGTLSTGSDPGSAVQVTARVATPACPPDKEDTLAIVITGGVANVSIGFSTEISANDDNTLYLLPVSVLVADTNGNPVSGAVVSLGLKPSLFATGYWLKLGDEWVTICDNPCDGQDYPGTLPCVFVNEDLNNNSILDDNEDTTGRYTVGALGLPDYFGGYALGDWVPGLNNGMLDPGQSVAGTIPATVTTGENGVASFKLTYQKEYAAWVEDQISATAMVFGTEYITRSRTWLPVAADEKELIANAFPTSPFNVLPCQAATAP